MWVGIRVGAGRIAAAIAAMAMVQCGRGGNAAGPAPEPPVTLSPENVAFVAQRTLRSGPEISGTLRARRDATLRAEVGGIVREVRVEAGERVRKGALLARIDDAAARDAVLAARSGVAAAENALGVARANADRAETLAAAGAVAAQQAEQARAALESARAQLADARSRLALAQQQSGRTRVRSPFDGTVAQRQVSVGDVVQQGTALFGVIDPRRLEFEGSVPAARLSEVRPGAPVELAVTGFEGEAFRGNIERIAPAVDPATGQVRVYVDVPNDDGRIVSGLYAQGRIAARSEVALAAPIAAVDAATTPATVMRVRDGKVEKVPVTLGVRDDADGNVAIASGVREGDLLVLGSARSSLAEGTPVRVAQERAGRRPPPAATGEAD